MAKLKHDATVGRLLIIDVDNPPDLTAEEFLSYMNEGFIPVFKTANEGPIPGTSAIIGYQLASYQSLPTSVIVSSVGIESITFPSAGTDASADEPIFDFNPGNM